MINPDFIAEYAILKTRWLECERLVKTQLLFKHQTNVLIANPAAELGLKYLKQADVVWGKIWDIVAQNCEYNLGGENPNADAMSTLLNMKMD